MTVQSAVDVRGELEAARARIAELEAAAGAAREAGERQFRGMADSAPVMMWVTEPDGRCTFLNARWYEFTGQREEEGLGFGWVDAVHPDDRAMTQRAFVEATATAAPFRVDYRLRRADGSYRWCIDAAAPRVAADGSFLGYVGSVVDVDERARAEQAREAARRSADLERRRLDAVLAALPVGVIVIEAPDGRVRYANQALRDIWGQAPHSERVEAYSMDWLGFHVEEGHPTARPYESHEWPVARVLRGEPSVRDELVQAQRPDGTRRMASVSAEPFHDESGEVLGVVGVIADVEAQHQTRVVIEAARRAAEDANRAKSEFLAAMSHELRTPLNAIGGHVQLLEMGLHGELTDGQRRAVERVERAQRHLLGLINDILNYARLEAGKVEYTLRAVRVGDVVGDVLPLIEPQMVVRRHHFDVRLADPAAEVWADREKLGQVLLNLLSNAVKFTPEGGHIVLDAPAPDAADGGLARIRVRDDGRGIPADKLDAIFAPFVQVDSSWTRRSEGTGLGLAISRDLARGMGGELLVESAEGAGALFTVVLRRPGADTADA